MLTLSAPVPLTPEHLLNQFDCGYIGLNTWLYRHALKNQYGNAGRTFVVCEHGQKTVLGYYTLAAGALTHEEATGSVRRNMPSPIPVIVLGRLAVDRRVQGKHVGASLLRDAVLRAGNISSQLGARALLVHAVDDGAKQFYLKYGFAVSPVSPYTLMLK